MKSHWLPAATALLPVVAVHVSLILAIRANAIAPCIPYLEGCASISATGRSAPAVFVFKPAMMTQWALLFAYWLLNAQWLRLLANDTRRDANETAVAILGCAGAAALAVYLTFLGTQEPFYEYMRRYGIYLYFLFTVLAQIILARRIVTLSVQRNWPVIGRIGRIQLLLCGFPFVLGILNIVLKSTLSNADSWENVIEWIVAFVMQVYFMLTYFCWRATGFAGQWSINRR